MKIELLALQMHDQLDQKLQLIIEEHREARKQPPKNRSSSTSELDQPKRTSDFVDVLLDLQADENTKERIEDITIKALILVKIDKPCFPLPRFHALIHSPRLCMQMMISTWLNGHNFVTLHFNGYHTNQSTHCGGLSHRI